MNGQSKWCILALTVAPSSDHIPINSNLRRSPQKEEDRGKAVSFLSLSPNLLPLIKSTMPYCIYQPGTAGTMLLSHNFMLVANLPKI